MNIVKWGMIGCGAVTEVKSAPAFAQVLGSSLVAVASRHTQKASDYAKRHGIILVFETPEALISSPDVQAVYIATPPSSHFQYAMLAAAAGKPCCVEKPMAMSHSEATQMNAAFDRAGQPLFVSYYRRSLPRIAQVAAWIASGLIGTIRHVHWTLARAAKPADIAGDSNWRTDHLEAPGGYFDDLACHGLDLFDFLIGPIQSVSGTALNQGGHYGVPDAVAATWQHATGAMGTASWNFCAFKRIDEVQIHGSEGVIGFSVFDDMPLTLETASQNSIVHIENPSIIQLNHVENLMRHLAGEQTHPSTGTSAARTAWVMEQILQNSIKTNI